MEKIAKITRWHIVRVYEDTYIDDKSSSPYIEVSIHTHDLKKVELYKMIEELASLQKVMMFKENIDWWNMDEDKSLAGTITEEVILKHIIPRTSIKNGIQSLKDNTGKNKLIQKERKLAEDMVFLQLVYDDMAFDSIFTKLKSRKGILDISPILTDTNSILIDFTAEARKMSAKIYEDVMEN
ncbi:MAG: hypothetical protein K8R58_14960 [Bacteroidales bacterium]|nr:hypothetical protein [Bacteroidales bacterium]